MSGLEKEYSWQNPNETFLNGRGAWTTYVIILIVFHLILLSIPFISTPLAWTLTNTIHNIIHYILFHGIIGSPFITYDQGRSRPLTCWEQMDHGAYYTSTKKFLYLPSIVLFILASHYTRFNIVHFVFNFSSLCLTLVPKFPIFYRYRLFGFHEF